MTRSPHSSIALVCLLALAGRAAADGKTGEQIYRQTCAKCHGANGEGVKNEYPDPLVGDKSAAQLAKLIAKTMPEDKPGTCVGEDADRVAAYIHDTFYSREARERNKPPRIELARLTVRQYRNAVADLVGSFRPAPKLDEKRGLKAEYFDSRNFRGDKRVIDRTDPEVRFDFKDKSPGEKVGAHEFAIRWTGSVLADETGVYEFIVRSDQSIRLWVNDNAKPLIDAYVKSGSDTEFRGTIFIVAGRAYPLKLEFSKALQGVQDKKAKEKPPAPAMVALEWKRPGFAQDVIPARNLIPTGVPESCVVSTPFPPDDRSLGWERGTTVSKAWESATTDAALETAAYVSAKLNEFAGTRDGAADRLTKAREFCRKFAERAFRRPLTEDQKRVYIDRQFDAVKDVEPAVKRVVLIVLKSPRFLYREVGGGQSPSDTAARLSFALWDSQPDQELLDAAAANRLATREQVAKQAERMLADPRAQAKLREFVRHWLTVDRIAEVAKDSKRFPGFDPAVVSDLRTSLDLFVDDVLRSPGADFRRFLLHDELYLNGRLAKFYGADLPADAGFRKVKLNPEQRAGVLTHPYLMSAFAYTSETSPIHRGVFLARGVLGITLKPPMEAFTPLPADLHPMLTTKERVSLQTKSQACQTCHSVINPLGFTLEHFDAIGRYREQENGKPVEDRGQYLTRDGKPVSFTGPRELAAFLAGSEEVHAAFAEKLFHHLVQQPVRAYGPKTPAELREKFAANGYSVRKLAVEIAVTAALTDPKRTEKTSATPASGGR